MTDSENDLAKQKVNMETAQIHWHELQRFFAAGLAVYVSAELDLVEVAHQFERDNKVKAGEWMRNQQIALVSDQQALQWFETNTLVWAVVVKPWVLVQIRS